MANSRLDGGFNTWLIIGALLGVLATPRFKSAPSAAALTTSAKASALAKELQHAVLDQEAQPPDDQQRLANVLRRLVSDTTGAAWMGSPDVSSEVFKEFLKIVGHELFPIVATLPDPRQPHLALQYDQLLVSLRRAAARLGFVQDRFALPWQQAATDPGTNVRVDPRGVITETSAEASPELPGLILFRKLGGQLLLAIVVTESPVLGASVPQLRLAFQLQHALAGPDRPLAILAPAFSGGVRSLIDALGHDLPGAGVQITTGTATSRDVDAAMRDAFPNMRRPEVRFSRTLPTDDVVEAWTIQAICEVNPKARFAALRELGTGYGGPTANVVVDSETPCLSSAPQVERVFRFPIRVSELRLQHERSDGDAPALSPELRRTLALQPTSTAGHESDSPEVFSPRSACVDELALGQELARVCDERFTHLFVEATDPNDAVFLARQVRQYCRRPTLVTIGHEELFTHPDLAATFAGTLLASTTAPSLALSDLWTPEGCGGVDPFPNSTSQGYFDAVLDVARAVGATPSEEERSEAAPNACQMTAQAPFTQASHWPFFLSEIGAAGTWPVRATRAVQANAPQTQPEVVISSDHVQHRIRALSPMSAAPVPAVSPDDSSMKTGGPRPPRLPSEGARPLAWPIVLGALLFGVARLTRWNIFAQCSEEWRWRRKLRLAIGELSAALLVALVTLPFVAELCWVPLEWQTDRIPLLVFFGSSVGAGLLACASVDFVCFLTLSIQQRMGGWRFLLRTVSASEPVNRRVIKLLASLLAPLTLAGAILFSLQIGRWMQTQWSVGHAVSVTKEDALVVLRLLNPFGVSPTLPLACLAAGTLLWSSYALCRITRLDRFSSQSKDRQQGLIDEVGRLWTELYQPWVEGGRWFLPLVLSCGTCGLFLWRLRGSFESAGFDEAFSCGFFGLSFLVAAEAVRFLTLSKLLIDAARTLAAQPMVAAYDRISTKICGSFGLQLSARVPRAAELASASLSSQAVASLAASLQPPEPVAAGLRDQADRIHATLSALRPPAEPESVAEREVHQALFDMAETLISVVSTEWRRAVEQLGPTAFEGRVASTDLVPGGRSAQVPVFSLLESAAGAPTVLFRRAAEDFIALRMTAVIYQVLHELRHTLTFALLGALLLVLSVLSYPFSSGNMLQMYSWSLVVLVALLGLCQMLALERNELLSRISGSRPDHIEWNANFVHQLVVFVALPLTVVLFGVFPGLGDAFAGQLSLLARVVAVAN